MPKTITFIGASSGCGLSALRRALADGHACIALARSPAKLQQAFPDKPSNLYVREGDAHDVDAVMACLTVQADSAAPRFVDAVCSSIGGVMTGLTFSDPNVCKKGASTLLDAVGRLREMGTKGQPLIVAVSTTGISKHQRDVPLLFTWPYKFGLNVPHDDKAVMEESYRVSGERFVLIRPSLLVDGKEDWKECPIKVGIEDLDKGVEVKAVGYTISRGEVGRWIYENCLGHEVLPRYAGKAVGLTW